MWKGNKTGDNGRKRARHSKTEQNLMIQYVCVCLSNNNCNGTINKKYRIFPFFRSVPMTFFSFVPQLIFHDKRVYVSKETLCSEDVIYTLCRWQIKFSIHFSSYSCNIASHTLALLTPIRLLWYFSLFLLFSFFHSFMKMWAFSWCELLVPP